MDEDRWNSRRPDKKRKRYPSSQQSEVLDLTEDNNSRLRPVGPRSARRRGRTVAINEEMPLYEGDAFQNDDKGRVLSSLTLRTGRQAPTKITHPLESLEDDVSPTHISAKRSSRGVGIGSSSHRHNQNTARTEYNVEGELSLRLAAAEHRRLQEEEERIARRIEELQGEEEAVALHPGPEAPVRRGREQLADRASTIVHHSDRERHVRSSAMNRRGGPPSSSFLPPDYQLHADADDGDGDYPSAFLPGTAARRAWPAGPVSYPLPLSRILESLTSDGMLSDEEERMMMEEERFNARQRHIRGRRRGRGRTYQNQDRGGLFRRRGGMSGGGHNASNPRGAFSSFLSELAALHAAIAGAHSGALPPELLFTDRDFNEDDYEALLELDKGVANRQGATQAEINKLQTEKVPRSGCEVSAYGDCCICLDGITGGQVIRKLECTHHFHKGCIDKWLKQKGACPICQRKI